MKAIAYSFYIVKLGAIILLAAIQPVAAEVEGCRQRRFGSPHVAGVQRCRRAGGAEETYIDGEKALVEKSPIHSSIDLLAQDNLTRVTGVEINQTAEGLELILETVAGNERLVPLILPQGNDLVIEILDATLAFAIRNGVRKVNPAPGISLIALNQVRDDSIRLTIRGETQTPRAEIVPSRNDLVLSITPERLATEPEADEEIEVIATGEAEADDYYVPNVSGATRTDTPILDLPQSVRVIPQEDLRDRQVTNLQEALQTVSGVFADSDEGRGLEFNLRGFAGAPVLRDGFRTFGVNNNRDTQNQSFTEIANIDRVEVLKGPAAILFGQIEPGGLINVVTKKPLAQPLYAAELQVGNRIIRPRIDLSGAITSDKSILYRLNALYLYEESFRDFDTDINRYFIAPSLTFKLGNRTDLNLQLEYLNDERPFDTGLVALGDEVADIPRDRLINEPGDFIEKESFNVGYSLEHRFSDNWKLRNAFRYDNNGDSLEVAINFPFIGTLNESTGELNRSFAIQNVDVENYALQTNTIGNFNTGAIAHQLLFGIDLARNQTEQVSRNNFANLVPINIFNPVYGAFPRPGEDDLPVSQSTDIRVDSLGIYLQDRVSFTEKLIATAGFRYDTIEQETIGNTTNTETTQNDDAFSPNLGLVYKPVKNLSLYASYSESFTPNAEVTADDEALDPETGAGYEIGTKVEFFSGDLLATLAYFDITKSNVATADPNNPLFSVATGEQNSNGIEIDVVGKILPGWNINASYSYIDAEITEDNTIPEGNQLPGVPEHSASLWTNYELQQGKLQGLGFGLGFNFIGDRQGDLDNSFELDSYFLTNAGVYYQRNNWRTALNFKNIFDVEYITGTPINRTRGIQPGESFTVIGSVSVEF